ncbi:nuclear transport factor 2 family protein [uncultured Cyclobacterium sp.]|uniref:nuclear transport factor 2 family protein n=1 Tax=uncultured Cyclobacterium sp. TaxID=453820 RepID=UPI0030ED7AF0|tara:strand:- start:44907 stop:45377 length:471 start_codon:yes stop_codon:yes gene_type:complete
MDNNDLLKKFYTSFSKGDSKGMVECYHKDIVFKDPVFGKLKGDRAFKMWEMLLSNKKADTKISFDIRRVSDERGKVNWVAEYAYGVKKRKVINKVSGEFKFKDDKIIEHIDSFNLWKWTKQAMGIVGYLIGWTPFMKSKIQNTTNKKLNKYIAAQI